MRPRRVGHHESAIHSERLLKRSHHTIVEMRCRVADSFFQQLRGFAPCQRMLHCRRRRRRLRGFKPHENAQIIHQQYVLEPISFVQSTTSPGITVANIEKFLNVLRWAKTMPRLPVRTGNLLSRIVVTHPSGKGCIRLCNRRSAVHEPGRYQRCDVACRKTPF